MSGCTCDISKILSYDESNQTLTIKGNLVVEGHEEGTAAVKIGSGDKPANLWVIGGVDINGKTKATGTTGYANSGDLRVGNDFFVKNRTILGDDELPSGLTLPPQHVYLTGSMDIGLNSGSPWASDYSLHVQGDVNADKIKLQAEGTNAGDAPILLQGLSNDPNKANASGDTFCMNTPFGYGIMLRSSNGECIRAERCF